MCSCERSLTFDANDVVSYLLGHQAVRNQINQVVDGINRRVDALEALDLLSDGQGVVEERLQLRP
jgi:hypothetical protein